jgi:hypothetical protein
MGIVCTVQSTNIVLKSGATKHVVARQTDCFERRESGWELIHQHASVPAGGQWDGKITTAWGLICDPASLPACRDLLEAGSACDGRVGPR